MVKGRGRESREQRKESREQRAVKKDQATRDL
jgi:hypothetical protein